MSRLAITPHSNLAEVDYFRFVTRERFSMCQVEDDALSAALERLAEIVTPEQNSTRPDWAEIAVSSSVVSLINDIVREAVTLGASDIHFEPYAETLRVRYRIDGALREMRELESRLTPPVISRLKILGGLDIAERRMPQDGRIRFPMSDKLIDIRLSTLPTDFGEKAVLRILDKSALRLDLETLGLTDGQLRLFRGALSRSHGIILVTGPTGSGKTTTLYSALNEIRTPEVNITTIEDPIEYNLEGVNQTQIKPDIGLDFAQTLRSVLRQDPNVIMVGEIRDSETLSVALRAALTGHLVFSTLHTNDAVAAIPRLLDLRAERGLLASALRLVIAQRLIRLLCPHCKTQDAQGARQANGCDRCYSSGYIGRRAVFEFLQVTSEFGQAIESGAPVSELYRIAREQGWSDLKSAALSMANQGLTDTTQALKETV